MLVESVQVAVHEFGVVPHADRVSTGVHDRVLHPFIHNLKIAWDQCENAKILRCSTLIVYCLPEGIILLMELTKVPYIW